MRSTVYMNHYPDFSSPGGREAVTVGLTMSVGELSSMESPVGYATQLTLGKLGIDRCYQPPSPSDMLLLGSKKDIKHNLRDFRINIGSIARQAADLGKSGLYYLPETLDEIAQHVIPSALDDNNSGFIHTVGDVLRAIGEKRNDDGCGVAFGEQVGGFSHALQRRRRVVGLPEPVKDTLFYIPALEPGIPAQDVSIDTRIVRRLAIDWALSREEKLRQTGATDEIQQALVDECAKNGAAIWRLKERLLSRTGRSIDDLLLSPETIDAMVATERALMHEEAEQERFIKVTWPAIAAPQEAARQADNNSSDPTIEPGS